MRGEITLRDSLLAALNEAIDYGYEVIVDIHAGSFGSTTKFIPTSVDEGSNSIIIYPGADDIFVIDTRDITWNDIEEEFICENTFCTVNICIGN